MQVITITPLSSLFFYLTFQPAISAQEQFASTGVNRLK